MIDLAELTRAVDVLAAATGGAMHAHRGTNSFHVGRFEALALVRLDVAVLLTGAILLDIAIRVTAGRIFSANGVEESIINNMQFAIVIDTIRRLNTPLGRIEDNCVSISVNRDSSGSMAISGSRWARTTNLLFMA